MAKFTEETLNNWRYPASDTEETKLANAEKMVREAIADSEELKNKSTEIFGQGSYANDTNVKINSDIDINVCLSDTIFIQIPEGKSKKILDIVTRITSSQNIKTQLKEHWLRNLEERMLLEMINASLFWQILIELRLTLFQHLNTIDTMIMVEKQLGQNLSQTKATL